MHEISAWRHRTLHLCVKFTDLITIFSLLFAASSATCALYILLVLFHAIFYESDMVFSCCVTNCRSGYKLRKGEAPAEKYSMFQFPTDCSQRERWKSAIPRKDFIPNENHRVCERHFHQSDFETTSIDTRVSRRDNRPSPILLKKRLKPSAVPSIFPECPKYLSKPEKAPRPSTATADSRRDEENQRIESLIAASLEEDTVDSLDALRLKLNDSSSSPLRQNNLPSEIVKVDHHSCLIFMYISVTEVPPTGFDSQGYCDCRRKHECARICVILEAPYFSTSAYIQWR